MVLQLYFVMPVEEKISWSQIMCTAIIFKLWNFMTPWTICMDVGESFELAMPQPFLVRVNPCTGLFARLSRKHGCMENTNYFGHGELRNVRSTAKFLWNQITDAQMLGVVSNSKNSESRRAKSPLLFDRKVTHSIQMISYVRGNSACLGLSN